MDCRNPDPDLDPGRMDETIQSLLRAEPMRSVPSGFGRKVKARVTLAAMLDWERQRWRYLSVAALLGLFVALTCVAVPALFPRALELAISYLVPGGAGYADYVFSVAWYGGYAIAALIGLLAVASLGAAAAALAYLIQRRRSWSPMGRS
ncbi:MAG: hypothetical protein NTZ09_11490 [Candidatus Hydrogenedentes bacterium]|nr:hypothetical protein [Candidatus Hydrogenedentota bacterium]